MNKKVLSRFTVFALAGCLFSSTVTHPITTNAATVTAISNIGVQGIDLDQIKNDAIDSFNNIFKDTESSIVTISAENYEAIVNSETGDITHKTYDENGNLTSEYTTNFFSSLENIMSGEQQNTRAIVDQNTTWGPFDSLHYTVDRRSDGYDHVYAQNSANKAKSYKVKNYWNDSNTRNFVTYVDNAENALTSLTGSIGATATTTLVAFLGIVGGPLTTTAIKAALTSLGLGSLVGMVSNITDKFNSYRQNIKNADRYWGLL